MNIETPALPYNFAALEPAMSRDTLVFHLLRYQRGCLEQLQAMLRGTALAALPLEELLELTEAYPALRGVHRFAAEVWNHDLFWRSMRPGGGGAAHGPIGEHIDGCFGGYGRFVDEFRRRARAHFGSGWLWLVARGAQLEIMVTGDSGTPLAAGAWPLLALDLWEHAYYLDHQDRRGAYITAFLEQLVNWDFANRRLADLEPGSLARAVAVSGARRHVAAAQ
jgi:superoxide dismutase, Fe-Mn family